MLKRILNFTSSKINDVKNIDRAIKECNYDYIMKKAHPNCNFVGHEPVIEDRHDFILYLKDRAGKEPVANIMNVEYYQNKKEVIKITTWHYHIADILEMKASVVTVEKITINNGIMVRRQVIAHQQKFEDKNTDKRRWNDFTSWVEKNHKRKKLPYSFTTGEDLTLRFDLAKVYAKEVMYCVAKDTMCKN